jgi:hypothetical protein
MPTFRNTLFHVHRRVGMMCQSFGTLFVFHLRRVGMMCQCFGTLLLFHLHRRVSMKHIRPTHLWRWKTHCVPNCWHLNYRRRGITQKKAQDIRSALRAMAKTFTISDRHKSFKEHPCNRGKKTHKKKQKVLVLSKVYKPGMFLLVFALSTDP